MDYQDTAARAVRIAAEYGYFLDYSPKSLNAAESFLNILREMQENESPFATEDTLWNAAVLFGVYLGEVLLRNELTACGYCWDTDGEGLPVLRSENGQMSPVIKTYKYVLNGSEDSIVGFYDVSVAIAKGDIPLGGDAE